MSSRNSNSYIHNIPLPRLHRNEKKAYGSSNTLWDVKNQFPRKSTVRQVRKS